MTDRPTETEHKPKTIGRRAAIGLGVAAATGTMLGLSSLAQSYKIPPATSKAKEAEDQPRTGIATTEGLVGPDYKTFEVKNYKATDGYIAQNRSSDISGVTSQVDLVESQDGTERYLRFRISNPNGFNIATVSLHVADLTKDERPHPSENGNIEYTQMFYRADEWISGEAALFIPLKSKKVNEFRKGPVNVVNDRNRTKEGTTVIYDPELPDSIIINIAEDKQPRDQARVRTFSYKTQEYIDNRQLP